MVADSAYAGKALRGLPATVTWTTRLRSNAALYEHAPPRTGRRGRPRTKGDELACLATLAAQATFAPTEVILVRDKTTTGYNVALVTTDLAATGAQIIERYAARSSIEVAIERAVPFAESTRAASSSPSSDIGHPARRNLVSASDRSFTPRFFAWQARRWRPGRSSASPPNRVTQVRGIPDEVDEASSTRGAIPTWTNLSR